jgi:hypothetical protein
MYDIPFDRSFLQLSNGIRHVIPSTDTEPELTAKASMAQPVSQPAVYANGLMDSASSRSLVLRSVTDCVLLPAFQVQVLICTDDSGSNPERAQGDKFLWL